jgi:polysaccharide biosynthesis protein PslG
MRDLARRFAVLFCAALFLSSPTHAGVPDSEIVRPPQVAGHGRFGQPLALARTMGINIHHVTDADLDMLAATGVTYVRLDVMWEPVERTPGAYDWSTYDDLLRKLAVRHLRPLLILAYSNPLYEKHIALPHNGRTLQTVSAPTAARSLEAFTRWAAAAATHFAPYDPVLEIWNEPDNDMFWPPRSNPREFAALARRTCAALRKASPGAVIIGPGAAKEPRDSRPVPEFLGGVLDRGLEECLDGVSVHPYVNISEVPRVPRNWELLRDLIRRAGGGLNRLPVPIASEWGVSTGGGGLLHRHPDDADQAFYLVRMMVLNAASGVPISIWYDWRDDGDDPNDAENRFGLVRRDRSPKRAYVALKTLTAQLGDAQPECLLMHGGQTTAVFRGPGDQLRLALWNDAASAARLSLPPGIRVARFTGMDGKALDDHPGPGAIPVDAKNVVYVSGAGASPCSAVAPPP